MRSGVKAYNKANRVPEALERGYHETITTAFMQLISEAITSDLAGGSLEDLEQQCPRLFNKAALLKFYSRDRILSAEAKASFVEPDLAPLSLDVLNAPPSQLVVFDIDGTLVQSIGVDDRCFTQAVTDALGVDTISTDWANYQYQTDAGIVFEIASKCLGSPPQQCATESVKNRFLQLLDQEANQTGFRLLEVPGAGGLLSMLRCHPTWCAAIATGGWAQPAKLKLRLAGVDVDHIPFASSDDTMAREDIIKCAIQRAEQHYGRNDFTNIVYVGDGSWDVVAARKLRIRFVGVKASRNREAFAEYEVPVVADFEQPLDFMRLLDSVTASIG
jgi:phosphoglycolate phosphatase-like HAD superfamily hydrolase